MFFDLNITVDDQTFKLTFLFWLASTFEESKEFILTDDKTCEFKNPENCF